MGSGESFGAIRRTPTALGLDGAEIRSDEFDDGFDAYDPDELLSDEARDYLSAYVQLVGRSTEYWYREVESNAAMVINHAVNDLLILVGAVQDGSGRTAARTARAMFEHLLHYLEISQNPAKGEQYAEHRHVTAEQLARRAIGLDRLAPKVSRRERARLDAMARRAKRPLAAAVAQYGPRFRSRWTAQDGVFDLAKRHDLEDDYDSYRILSAVLHGSAGALLGTRKIVSGQITHRVGPDLALLPLAYFLGVTWWCALIAQLPTPLRAPGWSIDFSSATDILLDIYPDLFDGSRRVDNKLWPRTPVPGSRVAVIAVYPGKKVRWFLHDLRTNAMWPAEPVGEVPDWVATVADREGVDDQLQHSGGRPVTFAAMGLEVKAIDGRRPVPAEAILLPHDVFGPVGVPVPSFKRNAGRKP